MTTKKHCSKQTNSPDYHHQSNVKARPADLFENHQTADQFSLGLFAAGWDLVAFYLPGQVDG